MAAAGKSFDPEKQFVLWYVIKWQNNTSPYSYWHVDGVVLNRAPYVRLNYHQNLNQVSGNVSNMPAGYQVLEGDFARIGAESSNGTVKNPSFPGYTFLGWSTTSDGGVEFIGGERYEMTRDLDLYGVWERNNVTKTVEKKWMNVDPEDQVPVTVDLKRKDIHGTESTASSGVILKSENDWSESVNVSKYDANGDPYTYKWVERSLDGFKLAKDPEVSGDHTVITNTWDKIEITIEAGTKDWTYDGSEHAYSEYKISKGKLLGGHSIAPTSVIISGKVKEVKDNQSGNNIITNCNDINIFEGNKDVTKRYKISCDPGTLTINPKPVTVTAPVLTKVYGQSDQEAVAAVEGEPTTVDFTCPDSADKKCDENLIDCTKITCYYDPVDPNTDKDAKGTYAADGTFTDNPYPIVFTVGEQQVNTERTFNQGNYIVTYKPGFLSITPKPVTVTAENTVKTYGDVDDPTKWTAVVSGTMEGEKVEYQIMRLENDNENTGRIRNADGTYSAPDPHKNVIIPYGDPYQGGQNKCNYKVTYEKGNLTINPRTLTVTAPNLTKTYGTSDNVPDLNWMQSLSGLLEKDKNLEEEDSYSRVNGEDVIRPQAGQTEFGGYQININGPDQFENYNVEKISGKLTITPRHLSVTSGTVTALWDGQTALECNSAACENYYVLTGDELGFSDTLDVEITGSQAGLGASYNKIGKVKINGTEEVSVPAEDSGRPYIGTTPFVGNTTNYDIEVREGMLTLTGVAGVVITALPQSKNYDSTPLTCTGDECISWVDLTGTPLDEGDRIGSITISGSQTTANKENPTRYEIESYTFVDKDNKDVTDKYVNVTKDEANATLTVHPVPLTIKTESKKDFVYDGTPHSHKFYDCEGLQGNDKIDPDSINFTGVQINAGDSENTMDAVRVINQAGDPVTTSYILKYDFGELKVNPKPVTVTVGNYQKEYGENDPDFTAQVHGTLPGDEGEISYTITREEGEDPGSYKVNPDGEKDQGNYTVTYEPGTLTVILNPTAQTVSKVWADDNNRDGLRPVSLGVTLTGSNGMTPVKKRLSADNNWTVTVPDLPVFYNGQRIVYEWTEEDIPGYTGTKQVSGNLTIFTNTHAVSRTSASVNKIWDDKDNAGNTRPSSLGVVLQANNEQILGRTLSDENNWSITVDNLPVYENGSPINYVWFERSVGSGYYAVSSVTSGGSTTLVNSNLHRLTIHYRYNDGREAHADYTDRLYADEIFSVNSPLISGFTANPLTVVGVMPAHDFEIIVIYAAAGEEVVRPVVTPTPVPTVHPEDPHKDVPHPRDLDPDADHPLVVPVPNMLIEIDDLNTALGLGEVNASNYGFALE